MGVAFRGERKGLDVVLMISFRFLKHYYVGLRMRTIKRQTLHLPKDPLSLVCDFSPRSSSFSIVWFREEGDWF